jgi:cytoskeletal protein CcmA (bactofilin family)
MTTPSPGSAVFDRHASVSGKLSGSDLVLHGSFDGELTLTGRLQTAPGSRLKARVRADVVEIEGEFEGEIRAGTLRVSAGARARGTFVAERLSIEEGAFLEGSVQAPALPIVAGASPGLALAPAAPTPAKASEALAAPADGEAADPVLDEQMAAVVTH